MLGVFRKRGNLAVLRVYLKSLGCPKNRVDTERVIGSLIRDIDFVDQPEDADLVFINTCAFIGPAVEESIHTIVQMATDLGLEADGISGDKKCGKVGAGLARRPSLAVAGCLVGRYGLAELRENIPEVDIWLHPAELAHWPRLLAEHLNLAVAQAGRILSTGPSYAWLKIGEGCRHNCSFCVIPSIRGKYTSISTEFLVEESRLLLEGGVRELVLVAQDVTAWGSDVGQDLRHLLEKLLPLSGLAWLRLMYLYPAGLTSELLSFLAQAGSPFVPYFDVPLQHAHPDILRRMGRPFAQNPQEAVDRIRNYFPEAAMRTTIMVGFPGETEAQFNSLCDFIVRNRFHHLGVFAYQPEDGTEAAAMPDQVPDRIKEERRDAIMELQNSISEDILCEYQGRDLEILIDAPHEEWPGLFVGRSWFQAPEVDGITYVSGEGAAPGQLVIAEIDQSTDYDLVGLIISDD